MSEQIKVVVIEDEMPAARLLSSMLKELRPECTDTFGFGGGFGGVVCR